MKTHFKASIRRPGLHAAKTGFTLIELLVVITIIAVLAGLLFPAMGAVRTQARKTSAKNDVVQIVNAVKAFYLEYSRYPGSSGNFNTAMVLELTGGASTETPTHNTRKIRFLEIPAAKNGRNGILANASGLPQGATGTAGDWVDPWGSAYWVQMDTGYTNSVTFAGSGFKLNGSNVTDTVQTGVIAASKGNPANTSGDAILSWK